MIIKSLMLQSALLLPISEPEDRDGPPVDGPLGLAGEPKRRAYQLIHVYWDIHK